MAQPCDEVGLSASLCTCCHSPVPVWRLTKVTSPDWRVIIHSPEYPHSLNMLSWSINRVVHTTGCPVRRIHSPAITIPARESLSVIVAYEDSKDMTHLGGISVPEFCVGNALNMGLASLTWSLPNCSICAQEQKYSQYVPCLLSVWTTPARRDTCCDHYLYYQEITIARNSSPCGTSMKGWVSHVHKPEIVSLNGVWKHKGITHDWVVDLPDLDDTL